MNCQGRTCQACDDHGLVLSARVYGRHECLTHVPALERESYEKTSLSRQLDYSAAVVASHRKCPSNISRESSLTPKRCTVQPLLLGAMPSRFHPARRGECVHPHCFLRIASLLQYCRKRACSTHRGDCRQYGVCSQRDVCATTGTSAECFCIPHMRQPEEATFKNASSCHNEDAVGVFRQWTRRLGTVLNKQAQEAEKKRWSRLFSCLAGTAPQRSQNDYGPPCSLGFPTAILLRLPALPFLP